MIQKKDLILIKTNEIALVCFVLENNLIKVMELKETKQDIESKFQIILTLSMFFPTILLIFLQSSDMENKKISDTTLSWSILVGLYIINYVFFNFIKKSCTSIIILKWIYWALIVGICFLFFH